MYHFADPCLEDALGSPEAAIKELNRIIAETREVQDLLCGVADSLQSPGAYAAAPPYSLGHEVGGGYGASSGLPRCAVVQGRASEPLVSGSTAGSAQAVELWPLPPLPLWDAGGGVAGSRFDAGACYPWSGRGATADFGQDGDAWAPHLAEAEDRWSTGARRRSKQDADDLDREARRVGSAMSLEEPAESAAALACLTARLDGVEQAHTTMVQALEEHGEHHAQLARSLEQVIGESIDSKSGALQARLNELERQMHNVARGLETLTRSAAVAAAASSEQAGSREAAAPEEPPRLAHALASLGTLEACMNSLSDRADKQETAAQEARHLLQEQVEFSQALHSERLPARVSELEPRLQELEGGCGRQALRLEELGGDCMRQASRLEDLGSDFAKLRSDLLVASDKQAAELIALASVVRRQVEALTTDLSKRGVEHQSLQAFVHDLTGKQGELEDALCTAMATLKELQADARRAPSSPGAGGAAGELSGRVRALEFWREEQDSKHQELHDYLRSVGSSVDEHIIERCALSQAHAVHREALNDLEAKHRQLSESVRQPRAPPKGEPQGAVQQLSQSLTELEARCKEQMKDVQSQLGALRAAAISPPVPHLPPWGRPQEAERETADLRLREAFKEQARSRSFEMMLGQAQAELGSSQARCRSSHERGAGHAAEPSTFSQVPGSLQASATLPGNPWATLPKRHLESPVVAQDAPGYSFVDLTADVSPRSPSLLRSFGSPPSPLLRPLR